MGHDPDYTTQVCYSCYPLIYPPPPPPPPPPPSPPPPPPQESPGFITFFTPSPPPPPPQESPGFITFVTFVSTCALLSICICPCLTRQCTQANTSSSPAAPSPANTTHEDHVQTHNPVDHRLDVTTAGVGESVLNSINVCRYKGGDGLVTAKECAVCLNEFRDGESLRLLPKCLHAFHVSCIDMWFESHVNCPLCRSNVIPSPLISMPKDTGSSFF